jgi:nitrogen fixation/metabolism regulation signal transduction histidine kinase
MFAPAARAGTAELKASFAELKEQLPYDAMLELVPDISFIVNARRQVLYANSAALSMLGVDSEQVIGARPGEIIQCIHARETPGGCGTTEACRVCGAVGAVLEALDGEKRNSKECRITTMVGGRSASLDLLVTAVPVPTKQGSFAVVTMSDIGDTKRRQVLERLFFHDLMNSISSLQACVFLLDKEFGSTVSENDYFARLSQAVQSLIDEVCQQRDLVTMESGDLEPEPLEIELEEVARKAVRGVEPADYAAGKRIVLEKEGVPRRLTTDPVLLGRVLVNMLKNALEAAQAGENVELRIAYEVGRARISVSNDAYIPRELQLQIFQRSFSTKGRGRGIGTYSMKLLTEDYLGGKIGFESREEAGTTFWIELPGE